MEMEMEMEMERDGKGIGIGIGMIGVGIGIGSKKGLRTVHEAARQTGCADPRLLVGLGCWSYF